ncbi:FAD-dependent oxidoreductase [Helicobacter heilmannii]|uniref:FAD-dependent oxidoreductase n=1 Tax=Helicobacter heilmannii TaxID=35817 RepID=UPI001E429189|nr:FAD-dependent oxidoreductase [Helicobacter heilmannii]
MPPTPLAVTKTSKIFDDLRLCGHWRGILGHLVAMQLLGKYPDLKVLLLEKEATSALHQMGRNSGVIHAGVYYTPGSLKTRFYW